MIEGDWRGEEDSGKYLVIKEKMLWLTRFFYKKNWQKIKQMLSNTLRLNFYFLKIIRVLHSRYHPGVVWHVPGNGQGSGCICFIFMGLCHWWWWGWEGGRVDIGGVFILAVGLGAGLSLLGVLRFSDIC